MPLFLRGQCNANGMLLKSSSMCWLSSLLENTTTTTTPKHHHLCSEASSPWPQCRKVSPMEYSPQCLHYPEHVNPGTVKTAVLQTLIHCTEQQLLFVLQKLTDQEGQHYSSTWIMPFPPPSPPPICLLTLRQLCTVMMPLWHESALRDLCYGNFLMQELKMHHLYPIEHICTIMQHLKKQQSCPWMHKQGRMKCSCTAK